MVVNVSEEDKVKALIDGLVVMLKEVEKPVQEQLDKIPRGVIDPRKWASKCKPELLEDKKFMGAIALWETMVGKKWQKQVLRKTTHTRFTIEFTHEESSSFEALLKAYYERDWNRFYLNMAKSFLNEYEYFPPTSRLTPMTSECS